MGKEFVNLTEEDLCDLMCGGPEPEPDEDDYCVKLGRYIPGGCDQVVCNDICQCPYRPEEIDLN
jgi:hypothetical protein